MLDTHIKKFREQLHHSTTMVHNYTIPEKLAISSLKLMQKKETTFVIHVTLLFAHV